MLKCIALCLFVAGAQAALASDPIANLALNRQEIPRYEKLELTFDLNLQVSNPFDTDEIAVIGVVRAPGGRIVKVPGFFYQGFARARDGQAEKLAVEGRGVWKVRYAPTDRGTHSIAVELVLRGRRYSSEAVKFRCVGGDGPGFVRLSGNRTSFELDDGSPYFAVGMNTCWGRSTFDYDRWFPKMKENGCNWGRLWIGPLFLFTLETQKALGRYDQQAAWRVDYVTELAERNGIRLMFCLESFNSLRIKPEHAAWEKNPYNAANGGPCAAPEDFFTDWRARKLFIQRLRYIVARWGYSAHVFAWELWNEVDIIETYRGAAARDWHSEMARYLRKIDPNRHIIGTSFAESKGDAAIDGLREMEFVQTHNYIAGDLAADLSRYCLEKSAKYGKPHFVGEFGLHWEGKGNEQDKSGEHIREATWATALSRSAGTGMTWWWDNYIEPNNLYHHYKPLAEFVKGVDWNKRRFRSAAPQFQFTKPQAPLPFDFVVAGSQESWEEHHPSNRPLTLMANADGTLTGAENLSRVLHGTGNHPTWHNPVTLQTDSPQPWRLAVIVTGVSGYGGAKLKVFVDERLALEMDFKDTDAQATEIINAYNGEHAVTIPAGRHAVKVVNDGADWIFCHFKLLGYARRTAPELRAFGVQDNTLALLWIQNETVSQHAKKIGVKPRVADNATLTLGGLRDGQYVVEFWDTATGSVMRQQAQARSGRISIMLPAVETDIGVKIRRK